jgi:malate/lactate dehydrogenase
MSDIAIVGAGELGGAIAHLLARRNAAAVVRLIDERGQVAAGKSLDIMQAAPIEGFATELAGSTEVLSAGGARIVVVADRAGGSEWQGEEGLRVVGRLREAAPEAVILCAGARQRELVDRAVRELHFDRRRILGTAPEALAAGARALVALALDGSPRDVALTVLGIPPSHTIVPWDDAVISGFRMTRRIDEPTRRRLAARIAASWPPGPHALAAVAGKAVDAIAGRTREMLSCFVAPEESARHRARTTAVPARLGARGLEAVVLPPLSVVDQVALDNATLL